MLGKTLRMRVKSLTSSRRLALFACLFVTNLAAVGDLRLIEAVKSRNTAEIQRLLKQGIDVNATYGDGSTALHWAAYWDDDATAERLLRAGAKVDAADDHGVTALWLAC